MRLTLRSMLAYMDEILEPADAAVVEAKIKESEYATSLLHRIRDVTRRLRLEAPHVEGPGMGLDPNTVSEYLDNTLSSERVPDFERVCLESDIHLAELAASHQILTLVLGEPAEVQPDSRQRMYQLASRPSESPAPGEGGTGEAIRVDSAGGQSRRKRPEVPDYLRDSVSSGRKWRLAAAAIVVLISGAVAVLAIGPQRIGELFAAASPSEDEIPGPLANRPDQSADPEAESTPDPQIDSEPTDQQPDVPTPGDDETADDPPIAVPTDESDTANDVAENEGTDAVAVVDPAPVAPLPDEDSGPEDQSGSPDTADAANDVNRLPIELEGGPTAAIPVDEPQGIGRFFSEKEVLLASGAEDEAWRRLPARALLFPGDKLLALPTYRPSVDFSVGIRLELLGDSAVTMLGPGDDGLPGLRVGHGRALLMTTAKPGTQLRLQMADSEGIVTFGDAATTLAIEVRAILPEGKDPETEAGVPAVELFAVTGDVRWQTDLAEESARITAPARWRVQQGKATPPETVDELPEWIMPGELSYSEQLANLFVEQNLPTDRSVSLSLRELTESRREEVRSLAARCLALIGEFEPFVAVLNDRSRRSAWNYEIEGLRAAISHSRESAARVREACLRQRGPEDGAALYRMLWGYDEQQIADGAIDTLLNRLDDDDLDFRVLAIWNLRRITGLNLIYYADRSPEDRKRYIQRWRDKLKKPTAAAIPAGS